MPALRQYVERRNVLAPYPDGASITPFRRIVDVLELLSHAMQADQPLHGLDALPEHAETLDTLRQVHHTAKAPQIQSVLRRRRGMNERAYDDPNRGARWYRFIETDLRFVNGVRELARVALDASAARAWERMYWDAIAPQLGAPLQLEGAAPWIAEHIADAGTRAPLEAFVATYRRDHHRALRRAITAGIQATRRHGGCWGSEPEQRAFVDALVEVNALHAERLEQFVTRLPDDALREHFQSAIFRRMREHRTQHRIAIPDALLR